MLAIIAFILFAVAGILKLVGKHADWILWLVIVGGALVSAEVAWVWNRGGRYRRGPVA
jgi:hypothetical protein